MSKGTECSLWSLMEIRFHVCSINDTYFWDQPRTRNKNDDNDRITADHGYWTTMKYASASFRLNAHFPAISQTSLPQLVPVILGYLSTPRAVSQPSGIVWWTPIVRWCRSLEAWILVWGISFAILSAIARTHVTTSHPRWSQTGNINDLCKRSTEVKVRGQGQKFKDSGSKCREYVILILKKWKWLRNF